MRRLVFVLMLGSHLSMNHFAPLAIDMWVLTRASGSATATVVAFDQKGFSINIP